MKTDYACDKCGGGHSLTSKIGKKHYIYRCEIPEWGYRTIICKTCGEKTTVKTHSIRHQARLCEKCLEEA